MFHYNREKNIYDFETTKIKGVFQPGGAYSGIRSLIHKDEGMEWVGDFDSGYPSYDIPPGQRLYILSFYHYLAKNLPLGILGRNMPGDVKIENNALILELGPYGPCKTNTKVSFLFRDAETLDLDITVTAQCTLKDFEICLSSYTVNRKWGTPYYYLSQQPANEGKGRFIQPQDTPFLEGWYHNAPRDNRTAAMTYDGRWSGDKYQIHITGPYYRLPILVSRNPCTGIGLIQMTECETCARVGSLYSSKNTQIHLGFKKNGVAYSDPNLKADYSPIYFYLFGEDFEPGMSRHARFRMILTKVDKDFSNVLKLYAQFTKAKG